MKRNDFVRVVLLVGMLILVFPCSIYAKTSIESAVNWAKGEVGKDSHVCKDNKIHEWANMCMHFCGHAYSVVPSGFKEAINGWDDSGDTFGERHTDNDFSAIPAGALVFFDRKLSSAGHVGVSSGKGYMIHAWENGVKEEPISSLREHYLGWRWPNAWTSDKEVKEYEYNETFGNVFNARCQGDTCWFPANASCHNAESVYLLTGKPAKDTLATAVFAGKNACQSVKEEVNAIADTMNHSQAVPNVHWWQSWWRTILGIFGKTANADDIRNYTNVIQISVAGKKVVSGKGSLAADAYGPGSFRWPTDVYKPQLPDFIVKEIKTTDRHGYEKTVFDTGEKLRIEITLRNIGFGNPNKTILYHVYLNIGYKEDSHSAWVRIAEGQVKAQNISAGESKKEAVETKAPLYPGVYNFVVCADHPKDSHNEGGHIAEEHESNNCSTEAVFEVVGEPPPPIVRSIRITDPDKDEKWKTSNEHTINWETKNLPKSSHVKIEFTVNNGNNWYTLDSASSNDGSKKWKMKDWKKQIKKDSDKAKIRITSVEYPDVSITSDKFKIDYKK